MVDSSPSAFGSSAAVSCRSFRFHAGRHKRSLMVESRLNALAKAEAVSGPSFRFVW